MQERIYSVDEEEYWVIWNGTHGILDTVTIGQMETHSGGRHAWLDEPYDMVGPFNVEELETMGQISFEACVVMSRQRWQADQIELRKQAQIERRKFQQREYEAFVRFNQRRQAGLTPFEQHQDKQHRESLNLPLEGDLKASQIKAAFRRLAQKAHPDVGGTHEAFVRITKARDVLIERTQQA